MALVAQAFQKKIAAFMKKVNAEVQEDVDQAIENFAQELEDDVYAAIKSITITIPTGGIQVAGSPTAQSNPAPIILTGSIS